MMNCEGFSFYFKTHVFFIRSFIYLFELRIIEYINDEL